MGFVNFLQDKKKAADDRKREREQKEAQERERKQKEKEEQEQKVRDAEQELLSRMAESPILDMIFQEIKKEEWAMRRQGSEDNGGRDVILTEDSFEVEWSETHEERIFLGSDKLGFPHYRQEWVKNTFEKVNYGYTKSGFAPLSAYTAENGVEFSTGKVVALWRDAVMQKMAEVMPDCEYSKWQHGNGFKYTLPVPKRSLF